VAEGRRGVAAEWRATRRRSFPGTGQAETFLNRLASTRLRPGWQAGDSRRDLFTPVHPVLHRPALGLLHIMWWWHYRVQRDSCREGSRLCWQADHWRDGKLGPLAADMARQLAEHERYEPRKAQE
jgi:hypothetical protein